ncbi:fungal trichothecene efflux pump-domain-containing protein [Microdochium trichocladiopsis]|uniref:Fungal trichothecene efflux pump-domain-containing protein n=1 Tax=Microdochium trichocladiopsis TaxID=1682393 RepID=A0A9P9BLV2_9PEZI|nr:fungal trichothecene efflux pump-domain-containing protein [Microdochium trichocladiopsis]KAH7028973.1 fungal trichothecene efflux pump-domain-containing protein [Microdochium trichocladiopsis]
MAVSEAHRLSADHDIEKHSAPVHAEDVHGPTGDVENDVVTPPGYFRSKFFLGTMAGIGLGLMAGSPNVVWVALSYTLTSAVTLTIIGRVSDIFGRRWVFVGGAALGIIGSIVCATAQDVNTLIGGTTIIGIAAATQLSYFYVMGELVPMKYRLAGNAFCYLFCIPGSGVAPRFDYLGTTLYTGGLLILVMGLNWGGSVYPWASSYVIATIVVGLVTLVLFVLWETFAKLKEPLVPMNLFSNYSWNASVILTGLGASSYYAFAIVWPSMVGVLYAGDDVMGGAWLSSFVGLFVTLGQIAGGFLGKKIGHLKWQAVVTMTLGAVFFGSVATCGPDTRARAASLVAVGIFFVGWTEGLAITIVTLTAPNQHELGTSAGVAGSIRFLISSIASTVYNVVLSNRLAQTIPAYVPAAVTAAGLPAGSVTGFITVLTGGGGTGDFGSVPGASAGVIAAGVRAYKEANADAYRAVFFTNIGFSCIAIVCCLLLPEVDHLMTGLVATKLHERAEENGKLAR